MTKAGKSHIAYQQQAAKARKEADSIENIYKNVVKLQRKIKSLREQQTVKNVLCLKIILVIFNTTFFRS